MLKQNGIHYQSLIIAGPTTSITIQMHTTAFYISCVPSETGCTKCARPRKDARRYGMRRLSHLPLLLTEQQLRAEAVYVPWLPRRGATTTCRWPLANRAAHGAQEQQEQTGRHTRGAKRETRRHAKGNTRAVRCGAIGAKRNTTAKAGKHMSGATGQYT